MDILDIVKRKLFVMYVGNFRHYESRLPRGQVAHRAKDYGSRVELVI